MRLPTSSERRDIAFCEGVGDVVEAESREQGAHDALLPGFKGLPLLFAAFCRSASLTE